MDKTAKIATGAGLLAVVVALGCLGYQRFKPATYQDSLNTSQVQPVNLTPNAATTVTSSPNMPPVNTNLPAAALPTATIPSVTQAENSAQLNAQRGVYAAPPIPVNGSLPPSSVTTTNESSTYTQSQMNEPAMVDQKTVTSTTKTAYVRPSTTVHTASIHRRIKHHKSGNVHVARAVKHTIGFTAALPKRLRF
jgi:hypothetical protein